MTNILMVEDDDNTRALVQIMLKRGGYTVRAMTNAAEALIELDHEKPDLIILDLALPGMSGIELCRYIREHAPTRETPILILTASTEEISVQESQEAGANDLVTKPILLNDLLEKIRSLLHESASRSQS